MIKQVLFFMFAMLIPMTSLAKKPGDSKKVNQEYKELVKKSPLNKMYPKQLAPAAAKYFGEMNKSLFAEGPIKSKEARLAAVSASAAIRCEYCITAQVHLAKKAGATDDEIRAAIQIAGEIARFSILLYGNEFGQEKLKKVLKINK